MNIYSMLKHLPVAWVLALAAHAAAAPPLEDAAWASCTTYHYQGNVPTIQASLNRIYGATDEFKTDAGEGGNPLNDGLLGKVTLKWLGNFCSQHPFKVRKKNFEADVFAELVRFGTGTAPATPAMPAAPASVTVPVDTIYRYDPQDLRKPKDIAAMVPRLLLLTERYPDKQQFSDAVRRALPGQKIDADTMEQIARYAAVDGYMLPGGSIGQIKGLSDGLRIKLAAKAGIEYASADELHLDLEMAAGDDPEKAELGRHTAHIDQLARKVQYRIPPTIGADLAATADLEPPVAELYQAMAHIAYPSADLFLHAMRSRVERALDMCKHDRYRHEGRLDDGHLEALLKLVDGGKDAGEVNGLRTVERRCSDDQSKRAAALVDRAHIVLYGKLYKAAVLVVQGVPPRLAGQGGPGALLGCGCAPDPLDGMTYHFYPLWTHPGQGKIDFDVVSRVGLYGVTVNDKGGLDLPAGVTSLPWTLLEAAHRHRTKVDWVVSRNAWPAQGPAGLPEFLASLRQNIGAWLHQAPPTRDWRGTALATFGLEQGPTAGDGITLRFERFPAGLQEQAALQDFVAQLAKDLHAMKPARRLSLMLDEDDIIDPTPGANLSDSDKRPFSALNLHAMMQHANEIDYKDDPGHIDRLRADDFRVLVMLREPTTRAKLQLRANIESSLFSKERIRVLRNIIPVMEYDGVRTGYLIDEITYYLDNFGGIGFWPLTFADPTDADSGSTSANRILHGYFAGNGADGGVLAEALDLICPNRAWLRWLAWISSIAAVVAGVTLARCRGCGTRLDNNAWYMAGMIALIVLPFLVITTLVVGDPLFKSDSGVHWFIAAILIGVVIIPGAYGLLKPARKLP